MPDLPAWAASVFLTAALAVYHFIANGEHESQHGSPSIVLRLWQPQEPDEVLCDPDTGGPQLS